MRTTIDLPDGLFRQLKARAALRGETLKECLLRAVRAELRSDGDDSAASLGQGRRIKLPIVESKEASYDLSPDRVAEILEEEDREVLAGH